VQRVWRVIHLRAWPEEVSVQVVQGGSISEHGRVRSQCKECGGSGICEHGRIRSSCEECDGSAICEHDRIRSRCKECKARKG